VSASVTDEQIRDLAATAKPYSLVLMRWTSDRRMAGADAIELEHQRRLVTLRAGGVIAVLCPIASDTLAGMAIMTVPVDEARRLMTTDPCVAAGMMTFDAYRCHGFPGDGLPG
jgi:hypothetical protein